MEVVCTVVPHCFSWEQKLGTKKGGWTHKKHKCLNHKLDKRRELENCENQSIFKKVRMSAQRNKGAKPTRSPKNQWINWELRYNTLRSMVKVV